MQKNYIVKTRTELQAVRMVMNKQMDSMISNLDTMFAFCMKMVPSAP
jgi:hypothetical protein